MKKLTFILVFICLYFTGFGQVSSYTFSYSSGTYTPLTGGTPLVPPNSGLTGNGWYEQEYSVTLPFVYYFKGAGYSSIYINSNGHIAFDKPTLTTNCRPHSVYNGQAGTIMGYGCSVSYAYNNPPIVGSAGLLLLGGLIDLSNANPITYGTIGTAPNRIFVVQWTNTYRILPYYGTVAPAPLPSESVTFQIRLKETSNVAEIVYNTSTTGYESNPYYTSVGLTSTSAADINLVTGTTWTSVTNSTSGTTPFIIFNPSTSVPAGTTYTFTPNLAQMPSACSGTPTAATAIASTSIVAAGGSVAIGLSNLPLATGLTYQWQSSPTGLPGSYTNISGATDAAYTATPTATTYYLCQVACGAGTPVASSPVAVGYEASYPALPSSTYASMTAPCNVGTLSITGSCGTSVADLSNNLGSYNYTTLSGTSGTSYTYVDYTSLMPKVKLEGSATLVSTYSVIVNDAYYSTSYGVWIDLNDNGSFTDPGEYVGNTTGVSLAANTFTMTIPVNTFGIHRMRVRTATSGTITPTGLLSVPSQAIDYAIEVVPPTPTASSNSPVCNTGTLALTSATIPGAKYIWSGPLSYAATTTLPTQNYTVTGTGASGTYSLLTTVKGSTSCAAGTTAVVVNPQPSLSGASDNSPVCSDNTLNLIANSPANVNGYSWSGPVAITGATTATASVPSAQLSAMGTYTVTVRNGTGSGCSVSYTTSPVILQSPDISNFSISTTNLCVGSASTITINSTTLPVGSYFITYDISGANTGTSLTASFSLTAGTGSFITPILTNAGTTTVTITSITNAVTCTKNPVTGNTVNFTVNPLPGTITGTNVVCEGLTTALTDAGGGTWLSDNTTIATVSGTGSISGVLSGTATITYTLPTGCMTTRAVTVNATPLPITGTLTVCKGQTTALTDATNPGVWTSSNTTQATVVSGTGLVTGASAGTSNITFTATNSCYTTAVVTVNPLPAVITGIMSVCEGLTTTLSDSTPFGLWSSGNTASATTITGSNIVTGVLAGTADITYTLPTGCMAISPVTVNPLPAAITGTMNVCEGLTTTLSNAISPGTWSSGAVANAVVSPGIGVVTGVLAGTSAITYTLPTGCITVATVTVNSLPTSISGTPMVCEGSFVTLNSTPSSGTWTSDNTAAATVAPGVGFVTGVLAGSAGITYTLPTGCLATTVVTVNPLPAPINGITNVCKGLTTILGDITAGGSWSSSDGTLATVSGTGSVTGVNAGSPVITYRLPTGCINTTLVTVNPIPASITGTARICEGFTTTLSDATLSGTWSSTSPNISIMPATGVTTGVTAGTADVTYSLSTGCIAAAVVTVNPSPAPVTGTLNVCKGSTTSLSNAVSGGAWSSSNALSLIASGTGVLTGVAAGTSTITYKLSAGCMVTATATVNALPAAIAGGKAVCEGNTTTLTNTSAPGAWTSSAPAYATIAAGTGIVTGVLAGTTAITYTLSTGCIATSVVTINPSPALISGVTEVCKGLTTPLSNAIAGGTWSSNNISLATVSGGGVVTGTGAGTPVITYKLPQGCFSTSVVTVDPAPAAITGTKQICKDLTANLKDITTGGTWSSSNTSFATVVPGTGVVTGVAIGTATITYELSTGCITTTAVTINTTPTAITGSSSVCSGTTITLADGIASGVWSSTSAGLVSVNPVSGSVTGITAGVAAVTYTLPGGCSALTTVSVNPIPLPYRVTGGGSFCIADTGVHIFLAGSDTGINYQLYQSGALYASMPGNAAGLDYGLVTTGGVYTVVANNRNTGCINNMPGSALVTVIPLPPPVTGSSTVCVASNITLAHHIKGGTWSSSDVTLATINPVTGLVKGVLTGVLVITYSPPTGCFVTTPLTVIPLPDTIVGSPVVCAGLTTVLSDATLAGTWSSSRSAIAGIDPLTGLMTGIFRGNCIITYTAPNGCTAMTTATVNPLPDAITGASNVCVNGTAYLSDAYAGGTWKTGSNAIATTTGTGTAGIMTGVAQGTTTVTYTLPTGCLTTGVLTVDPLPKAGVIAGPTEVCQNKSITLSDNTPGGVWSSDMGRINVTDSGLMTGAFTGIDTILYSVTNVCGTASAKWQVTVTQCDFTEVPVIINAAAELKVYPNPNDGMFTVNLLSDINEPVTIIITDMIGQQVKEMATATNTPVSVHLNMAAGIYLLTGYTTHARYVAKVTIN